MGDKHTKQVNLAKIGLSWQGFKQSVKFVSISIGIPVLVYNIIAWPLLVPRFYPRPLDLGVYRDVLIVFFAIFLFYFSLEVISKTQLFELPYEYPSWKGYVQEVLVNGTLIWLMWIVAYLVGGLFMNEHLKWLIVQNNFGAFMLLAVNGIMIGIQGIMAYLSAFFYQRTKNIFSVVLFQTVIVVLVITGKLVFIFSVV
jgi:hypothetical protein